tara:strand:+ start:234 stop:1325 length:1092 start_codon:yes stop_codon:yes gene_type:complete
MAADRMLVQGAGQVAQASGAGNLAASKAMSNIGKDITQRAVTYMDEKAAEAKKEKEEEELKQDQNGARFDAWSDKVLTNGSKLSDAEYGGLYENLQEDRQAFIDGDKKTRALIIKRTNEKASSYEEYNGLVDDVAVLGDKDNMNGFSEVFKKSDEGALFIDVMEGKTRLTPNPEAQEGDSNDMGVMMNDNWMSIQDLKTLATDNTIDSSSKEIFQAIGQKFFMQTGDDKFDPTKPFPTNEARKVITDQINTGNLKSMQRDPMFGTTSFLEDRKEGLVNGNVTYEDLGITEDMLLDYPDIDVADGIDEDEADMLMQSLQGNEKLLKEEMVDYFTMYAENQWKQGGNYVETDGVFDPNTGENIMK